MKLAEALSNRSDLQKHINMLNGRLQKSCTVKEGNTPPEDIIELLKELDSCLGQFQKLVYRINVTNLRATIDGRNLTEIMAERDALQQRVKIYHDLIKTLMEGGRERWSSEEKTIRLLDVPAFRKEMDSYSRQLRQLDLKLQQANWSIDLAEV